MMQPTWKNPFEEILSTAKVLLQRTRATPEVHEDPSLVPSFVLLSEKRSFILDILDRIEMLARCFDRLHALGDLYRAVEQEIDNQVAAQRASDPKRLGFDVSGELVRNRNDFHGEAMMLVSFAYYEMSAVVGLLRGFFKPTQGSDLEYLIGVRNKLLVHPHRAGRTRNSDAELSIGLILHAHLLGTGGWMPIVRNFYLGELERRGIDLDDHAGTAQNVSLLRDPSRRVETFTDEERLQLKAFVIPEPNLVGSADELADLLKMHFLGEVKRVCEEDLR